MLDLRRSRTRERKPLRRRHPAGFLLLLASLLHACGSPAPTCDSTSTLTWDTSAHPVISRACAGCHGVTGAADGLRLTSAAQVRAAWGRVEASLSDGSMPPRGAPPLTTDERRDLSSWLTCGAPSTIASMPRLRADCALRGGARWLAARQLPASPALQPDPHRLALGATSPVHRIGPTRAIPDGDGDAPPGACVFGAEVQRRALHSARWRAPQWALRSTPRS